MDQSRQSIENREFAQWLGQQSVLPEEQLRSAWAAIQPQSPEEFLAGLVQHGALTTERAAQLRSAFRQLKNPPSPASTNAPPGDKSTPSAPVQLPAPYQLISEVSRGGMARIFKAQNVKTGAFAAVKILLSQAPTLTEVKRLEYEARTLQSLQHRNVVKLLDYKIDAAEQYLILEFVTGESLKSVVDDAHGSREGLTDFRWFVDRFIEALLGLQHCHSKGLLHRDIKPENILVENKSERVVIIDFGIVRKAGQENSELSLTGGLTVEGQTLGTPEFMAPEQIDSKATELTVKTDVWGVGATLYYTLTGRSPYGSMSPIQLYKKILTERPVAPDEINHKTPKQLSDLCMQCLLPDPEARIDLDTLILELRKFQIGNAGHKSWAKIAAVLSICLILIVGALVLKPQPPNFKPEILLSQSQLTSQFKEPKAGVFQFDVPLEYDEESSADLKLSIRCLNNGDSRKSKIVLPTKGSARAAVNIAAGRNEVSIEATHGEFVTKSDFVLIIDNEAPILMSSSVPVSTFNRSIELTLKTDQSPRTGLADEFALSVLRGQKTVAKRLDFQLEHTVRLELAPGDNVLTFVLSDRLGNQSKYVQRIRREMSISVDSSDSNSDENGYTRTFKTLRSALKWLSNQAKQLGRLRARVDLAPGEYPATEIPANIEYLKLMGLGEAGSVTFKGIDEPCIKIHPKLRESARVGTVEIENVKFLGKSEDGLEDLGINGEQGKDTLTPGIAAVNCLASFVILKNCKFVSQHSVALTVSGTPFFGQVAKAERTVLVEECEFASGSYSTIYCHSSANIILKDSQFFRGKRSHTYYSLFIVHKSRAIVQNLKSVRQPRATLQAAIESQIYATNVDIENPAGPSVVSSGKTCNILLVNSRIRQRGKSNQVLHKSNGLVIAEKLGRVQLLDCTIENARESCIRLSHGGTVEIKNSKLLNYRHFGIHANQPDLTASEVIGESDYVAFKLKNTVLSGQGIAPFCLRTGRGLVATDCEVASGHPADIPDTQDGEKARKKAIPPYEDLSYDLDMSPTFELAKPTRMPIVKMVEWKSRSS